MAIQHDGWSIVAQYRKCGKAGCKACTEGRGHGPYYYGTKTVDGRRVSRYFGKHAPGEDTQDDSQERDVAPRAELDALRQENARLHALVADLQGQLAKGSPSEDAIETENDAEVSRDDTSVSPTKDNEIHGLTANQQAVLSVLRQECGENGWVTALSLGRQMGLPNRQASSRTLPVLRRLVELGYAQEIERNKFKLRHETSSANIHNAPAPVVDGRQELTRVQVEDIWCQETSGIDMDQDVLTEAYESFIRGLFRNTQDEHTRICIGKEPRAYVCPFRTSGRGAHRTFGTADRLVRTAVPWVVSNVASRTQRGAELHRNAEARATQQRQRYQRMPMDALIQLRHRMAISLQEGNNLGWILTLEELEKQLQLVQEVLRKRGLA